MREWNWGFAVARLVMATLVIAVPASSFGLGDVVVAAKNRATPRAIERFRNTDVRLGISDEGIASSSTIQVNGLDTPLADVNVTLIDIDFGSNGMQDVDVLLVGPGGSALILSDVGGFTSATNVNLFLDDQAPEQLPTSTALRSGAFQPTNVGTPDTINRGNGPETVTSGASLGVFNGVNPNGQWTIFVFDDSPGNDVPLPGSGINGGWALEINTDNGTPQVAPDSF